MSIYSYVSDITSLFTPVINFLNSTLICNMISSKLLLSFILAVVSMNLPLVSSIIIETKDYGLTYAAVEHLTYDWTIRNFSLLPEKNGEYIESPSFSAKTKDAGWKIELYPRGFDLQSTDYVSVFLQRVWQSPSVSTKIHCEMLILKSSIVYVNESLDYTYKKATGYGWPKFALRSDLLKLPCSDDSFMIRARITMPVIIYKTSGKQDQEPRDLEKCPVNEHSDSTMFQSEEKKETRTNEEEIGDLTAKADKVIPFLADLLRLKEPPGQSYSIVDRHHISKSLE